MGFAPLLRSNGVRGNAVISSIRRVRAGLAAFGHHPLSVADRLRGIQPLRAGLRAVHDRVAAIEPERILEAVEPLTRALIAAVGKPAIGLQQDRRTEILVLVPPVARA